MATYSELRRYGSVVEHIIGNDEVEGSIPSGGTRKILAFRKVKIYKEFNQLK